MSQRIITSAYDIFRHCTNDSVTIMEDRHGMVLWDQSLQLAEIARRLKRDAGNATHFAAFDACRNTLKLTQPGTRAIVQSKGFAPVAQENGMLIAYATAEGELASDVGDGARRRHRSVNSLPMRSAFTMFTETRGDWTKDCWKADYQGAPTKGSAWTSGDCSHRVVRGGSWSYVPRGLRPAYRYGLDAVYCYDSRGFRLARTLPPCSLLHYLLGPGGGTPGRNFFVRSL